MQNPYLFELALMYTILNIFHDFLFVSVSSLSNADCTVHCGIFYLSVINGLVFR